MRFPCRRGRRPVVVVVVVVVAAIVTVVVHRVTGPCCFCRRLRRRRRCLLGDMLYRRCCRHCPHCCRCLRCHVIIVAVVFVCRVTDALVVTSDSRRLYTDKYLCHLPFCVVADREVLCHPFQSYASLCQHLTGNNAMLVTSLCGTSVSISS